jgi:adenosylmethionine-8-amino-7-oxononanoate aminotransferase
MNRFLGAGGCLSPPAYLKRLREICDAHGILMILDEVTGFWSHGHAVCVWAMVGVQLTL